MNTVLILTMILVDTLLIAAIFFYFKKRDIGVEILEEMTEERRGIQEAKEEIMLLIEEKKKEVRGEFRILKQAAAELEQESSSAKKQLQEALDEMANTLSEKFIDPIEKLEKHQKTTEILLKKSDNARIAMRHGIEKGERISRFFHEELPYDELLKELQRKKYDDARKLLSKGMSKKKVATEIGLRIAEVDMLQSVTL